MGAVYADTVFVATAFMVLFGLLIVVAGIVGSGAEFGGKAAAIGMGVFYFVFAVLYLFLGIYLYKFASAVKRCVASASSEDVEQAMSQQRSFWKLAGILALIMVALSVLFIAGAFVVGIYAGISGLQ